MSEHMRITHEDRGQALRLAAFATVELGACMVSRLVSLEEIQSLQELYATGEVPFDEYASYSIYKPAEIAALKQAMPTISFVEEIMADLFKDPSIGTSYMVRYRERRHEDSHQDLSRGFEPGFRFTYPFDGPEGTFTFQPDSNSSEQQSFQYGSGDAAMMAEAARHPLAYSRKGTYATRPHPRHSGSAPSRRMILIHDISSARTLDLDHVEATFNAHMAA